MLLKTWFLTLNDAKKPLRRAISHQIFFFTQKVAGFRTAFSFFSHTLNLLWGVRN